MTARISVLLDSPPSAPYHRATLAALDHALGDAADVTVRVVRTPMIDEAFLRDPGDGVWIGPGSPYDEPMAADELIRTARQRGLPLLAT